MSKGFNQLLDAVVRIDVREIAFEAGTRRYVGIVPGGAPGFGKFLRTRTQHRPADQQRRSRIAGGEGGTARQRHRARDRGRQGGRTFPGATAAHSKPDREPVSRREPEVFREARAETRDYTIVTEKLESRVGEEWALERWGLSVRKVSRAYARENQLEDTTGVVVIGVQAGFPAEVAGVSRGVVILKINQQPLASLDVLKAAHNAYEAKPAPTLKLFGVGVAIGFRIEMSSYPPTVTHMSLTEILDELPRLTHEERRLLARRALAEDEAGEVAAAEQAAAEGFALLDRMEAEDAARGPGK